jgi:DNA-binding transcriptional regulator YhcF (GntR family)
MSPTCSIRFFDGRKTLSAVARITTRCAITLDQLMQAPIAPDAEIVLAHRHSERYHASVSLHARELGLSVDRDAEVPVGTQLAWRLRDLVDTGTLRHGDRLPSVRELAIAAGVNVNTVRSVYGRLENEGLVSSEQGRGTFVAGAEQSTRAQLRRQIATLEGELSRRAPLPAEPGAVASGGGAGGRLPSTEELRGIRDRLNDRLFELDAERADVLRRLADLELPEAPAAEGRRTSSSTLRGAHVRWVGA